MKIGLYRIGPEPTTVMTTLFGVLEYELRNGTGHAQKFKIQVQAGARRPNGRFFKTEDEQKLFVIQSLFRALSGAGYAAFAAAVGSKTVTYEENGTVKTEPLWRWTIA